MLPQTLSPLVLLFVVATAAAQPPPLKLPGEVKGKPSMFVVVRAETEGKIVRWVALSPGLSVFPPDMLKDGKATVVMAATPGRYPLLAYTAKGDEPSEPVTTVIVIEEFFPPVPPIPPPPGPGPAPPDPTDPLTKRIRDALTTDPGAPEQKRSWAAALSGFYAAMAKHVATEQVATVGDLLADYRNAIPAVLPADAITGTRRVAGEAVAEVAGSDPDRKIDGNLKSKLTDLFVRLAAALNTEAKR